MSEGLPSKGESLGMGRERRVACGVWRDSKEGK